MKSTFPLLAAGILALGLTVGGWFVGSGFARARTADRFVTVKGLAERDVDADLALWPFQLVATANDLDAAQAEIARSADLVRGFLVRHGVDVAGLELQGVQVTDRLAQQFGGDRDPNARRYIVQQGMILRSEDPAAVHAASQNVGELVDAGVVMVSGTGYGGVPGASSISAVIARSRPGDVSAGRREPYIVLAT
jgi:hypothetical protein